MVLCHYEVDIVISYMETKRPLVKPELLYVEVSNNFFHDKIEINRINVEKFQTEHRLKFVADSEELKKEWMANGVIFTVFYCHTEIATGTMIWPVNMLENVHPKLTGFKMLSNFILYSKGNRSGAMEVAIRLISHIDSVYSSKTLIAEEPSVRQKLQKAIHNEDVLFMLNSNTEPKRKDYIGIYLKESKKVPDRCPEKPLDFTIFEKLNGKFVDESAVFEQFAENVCVVKEQTIPFEEKQTCGIKPKTIFDKESGELDLRCFENLNCQIFDSSLLSDIVSDAPKVNGLKKYKEIFENISQKCTVHSNMETLDTFDNLSPKEPIFIQLHDGGYGRFNVMQPVHDPMLKIIPLPPPKKLRKSEAEIRLPCWAYPCPN